MEKLLQKTQDGASDSKQSKWPKDEKDNIKASGIQSWRSLE